MLLQSSHITSNNRKTGVNVVALLNRLNLKIKMSDCQFCDLASEGPDIIMYQLKSIYNSPCKDSYPIHTCFPMIASNEANKI